jgi:hypothetical protein
MVIRHFSPFGFLIRFPTSVLHRTTSGVVSDIMKTEDTLRRFLTRIVDFLFVSSLGRSGALMPVSSLETHMYRKIDMDPGPV